MSSRINLKRGDTLELTVQLIDDTSAPINIQEYMIRCQGRSMGGAVIFDLSVGDGITKLDPANGKYKIALKNTATFPIDTIKSDIEYRIGESIKSTETFLISVVEDVTR